MAAIVGNPCLLLRADGGDLGAIVGALLHLDVVLVVGVHLHLAVVLGDQIRLKLEDGAADRQAILAEDRAVLEARKHHSCCGGMVL